MVENMLKRALAKELLQKLENENFPLKVIFWDLEIFGKFSNFRESFFGLKWSEIG